MATREETQVLIIGAGPSGLAVSACLSHRHIPHIILEKEDCIAPLWKKRAYAPLRLHLAKVFCSLPLRPHSHTASTYMSKDDFIQYLDDYVAEFNIVIRHCRFVNSALYVKSSGKWHIESRNSDSNKMEAYSSQFLVVASGANSKGLIPDISGLMNYHGVKLHSSQYICGLDHCRENVLVVGCGNSGMEVSLDLANHGANCSIVIRSPNYEFMLKEDGMPRRPPPFHWKGDNNIYCAGLARMGLAGLSRDAQMITDDVALLLQDEEQMRRGRVLMVMIFVFQILEVSMLLLPQKIILMWAGVCFLK
ncbi:hypothetical protein Nepgr_026955 [Nepenthes gracilis]|uniref:indole-3-pyruvate monooxygenase n=1 Tax=Nepenthes gracilis TaxID=150966 RepID=A0AAD3TAX4_NEPGR|nr:hypothetical protein Nepgr_026955 [Nepenthes gracilis]